MTPHQSPTPPRGVLAASADTITWEAQVGAGTLSIVSYWVCDDPA